MEAAGAFYEVVQFRLGMGVKKEMLRIWIGGSSFLLNNLMVMT
jgi:hypothetical protein